MQETAKEVLELLGVENNPLLQVAQELEHIALTDQYFIDRKLYPNVDFYSGIILEAIGFPTSMFTAIFALSRTVGWIAQWKEMIADPQKKIGRPRQLYHGSPDARLRARSASAEARLAQMREHAVGRDRRRGASGVPSPCRHGCGRSRRAAPRMASGRRAVGSSAATTASVLRRGADDLGHQSAPSRMLGSAANGPCTCGQRFIWPLSPT